MVDDRPGNPVAEAEDDVAGSRVADATSASDCGLRSILNGSPGSAPWGRNCMAPMQALPDGRRQVMRPGAPRHCPLGDPAALAHAVG